MLHPNDVYVRKGELGETPRGQVFPPIPGQTQLRASRQVDRKKNVISLVDNQQNHVLITKNIVEKSLADAPKFGLLNEYREANDPEGHNTNDSKSYSNEQVLVVDDLFQFSAFQSIYLIL